MKHIKRVTLVLFCILLAACATPPFELGEREVAPYTPVQALHQAEAQNALVMWGGQIVATQNFADYSRIEVVSTPLDSAGRPQLDDELGIRFVVEIEGFLEPVLYASGRYLTALGHVQGDTEVISGEALLKAPLLDAESLHLWPKDQGRWRPDVNFGVGVGIRL
jgi:outer membrane lipoprotein